MSDLISRKALNEAISYALYSSIRLDVSDIRDIINNQPTAYDVDKIVKEIKGMSGIQFDGRNESYELNWCISTDRVIEIVKGGGVDEIN